MKGQYCDLILHFPGSTDTILCHALILASLSEVIAQSLARSANGDNELIQLVFPGRSYSAVKGLLDFAYAFLATGRAPDCQLKQEGFDALAISLNMFGQQSVVRVSAKRNASTNTEQGEEGEVEDEDYYSPPAKKVRILTALSADLQEKPHPMSQRREQNAVLDCEQAKVFFRKDPEMCQNILDKLRAGKGDIRLDMYPEAMRYTNSFFRFPCREV